MNAPSPTRDHGRICVSEFTPMGVCPVFGLGVHQQQQLSRQSGSRVGMRARKRRPKPSFSDAVAPSAGRVQCLSWALLSEAHLFGCAEEQWWHLGDGDWKEAFTHHPRIGSSVAALKEKFADTASWSAEEQSRVQAVAGFGDTGTLG